LTSKADLQDKELIVGIDRFSKFLSLCSDGGAASLAASGACLVFPNSRRRTFLAIEAAALADSK
jgi:hypothetical protein